MELFRQRILLTALQCVTGLLFIIS